MARRVNAFFQGFLAEEAALNPSGGVRQPASAPAAPPNGAPAAGGPALNLHLLPLRAVPDRRRHRPPISQCIPLRISPGSTPRWPLVNGVTAMQIVPQSIWTSIERSTKGGSSLTIAGSRRLSRREATRDRGVHLPLGRMAWHILLHH